MSINPFRLRLLDILESLPQAMPLAVALERSHTREALTTMDHLAIELRLETHSFCLVHSTAPELQANAVLESVLGPVSDAGGARVYQRLLELNWREAPNESSTLGIDASREHIVLSTPLNLAEATTEDLVGLLLSSLRKLHSWRSSGFSPLSQERTEPTPMSTAWRSLDSPRA